MRCGFVGHAQEFGLHSQSGGKPLQKLSRGTAWSDSHFERSIQSVRPVELQIAHRPLIPTQLCMHLCPNGLFTSFGHGPFREPDSPIFREFDVGTFTKTWAGFRESNRDSEAPQG